MEKEQVEKLLNRFKYKDNFSFKIADCGQRLHIIMKVPYVESGEVGPIGYTMDFSWIQTAGGFFNVLFNHLVSMEIHEAKEWFLVDEEHFFAPHPVLKEIA